MPGCIPEATRDAVVAASSALPTTRRTAVGQAPEDVPLRHSLGCMVWFFFYLGAMKPQTSVSNSPVQNAKRGKCATSTVDHFNFFRFVISAILNIGLDPGDLIGGSRSLRVII